MVVGTLEGQKVLHESTQSHHAGDVHWDSVQPAASICLYTPYVVRALYEVGELE